MKTLYNKTQLATNGWQREALFTFFGTFTQPYFNVHTEVDITRLYYYAKWEQIPLSLTYLYAAREAACQTENFLYRLEDERVVQYEAVDISTTVLKEDKTVCFVHLPHHPHLHTFCQRASEIVAGVKKNNRLFNGYNGADLIHATTLPWFKFRGMEHAQTGGKEEAIPKLAFGRFEWKERRMMLPISVRLHHGLADGYHVHLFLENMQASIQAIGHSSAGKASSIGDRVRQWKTYLQGLPDRWWTNPWQGLEGKRPS